MLRVLVVAEHEDGVPRPGGLDAGKVASSTGSRKADDLCSDLPLQRRMTIADNSSPWTSTDASPPSPIGLTPQLVELAAAAPASRSRLRGARDREGCRRIPDRLKIPSRPGSARLDRRGCWKAPGPAAPSAFAPTWTRSDPRGDRAAVRVQDRPARCTPAARLHTVIALGVRRGASEMKDSLRAASSSSSSRRGGR